MTWIGRKKIAFIPLQRPSYDAFPVPLDWSDQILQRIYFNPIGGADQSLRAYIRAASSGLADLNGFVRPMEVLNQKDVPPDALKDRLGSQLQAEKFDAAALVMLGQPPTGQGQLGGFWARFDMSEGMGVWAMELMHCLTGFTDLYSFNGNMGAFDEMASPGGSHPSAYTKAAIQWLDKSAIAHHPGGSVSYKLHSVGLIQPPPFNRSTAVRVGSKIPYLMVEARLKVDQFDKNIPSEGVIVYRVQTSDPHGMPQNQSAPLDLLATTALSAGMEFWPAGDIRVRVTDALPGGFSVLIDTPDPNAIPWTSVSEGSTTSGGPITAVMSFLERITLFIANPNGGIYTNSGFGTSWGQWTTVSEGSSTPGAPVTAVLTGQNRITLFIADPNGGIYTNSGFGTSWGQWTTVSEGSSTPGAPVTAVLTGQNRITLFIADPNGGIYTNSGFGTSWGQWTTVSEGSSTPGAPVTAVLTGQNRITLFIANPNGGIYTNSGFGTSWGQWTTVSEGSSTPGAPVTAVLTGQNRITLFIADPNGGIYTNSGFGTSWGQWTTVSEGSSRPGAPVTALVWAANRVALFLANRNGGVYTTTNLQ